MSITLKNIYKSFKVDKNIEHVLKQVDLSIASGEMAAIFGPSGGGKSSLMNIISGLDYDYEGEVIFNGEKLTDKKAKQLSDFRKKHIGFVFQNFNLINHMDVFYNVKIPLSLIGVRGKEAENRVNKMLEQVGMLDYAHKNVTQLSGGQKQRVAIARALVNNPNTIIADEPTGSLDSQSQEIILNILKQLTKKGKTVIIVTHNPEVRDYADSVYNLRDGQLENEIISQQQVENDTVVDSDRIKFKTVKLGLIKMAVANFRQRLGRNIVVAFATAIGVTGILLSLGLGVGITHWINKTVDSGNVQTAIQVTKENKYGNITQQDVTTIEKKVGKSKIKYLEAPLALMMSEIELDGHKISGEKFSGAYANIVSLPKDSKIKYSSNTKETVKSGKLYTDVNEKGLTVTTSFLKDYNKELATKIKAKELIGKKVTLTLLGSDGDNEKTINYQTEIVRILDDSNQEHNSAMSSQQMSKIITDNHMTKIIPYIIIDLKNPKENNQISTKIQSEEKYIAFSQTGILEIIGKFVQIIRGLLVFMSSQAVVVAIIMISVMIYISVIERTREIGVLEAIGFKPNAINIIFFVEALLIAMTSLFISIILSTVIGMIGNVVVRSYSHDITAKVYQTSLFSLVAVVGLVIVMTLLASLAPTRKIAKLNPIEALRYE